MTARTPAETAEDLAARCEAASGPDRELDCLIYCATAQSHFEYWGGECVLAVQGGFSARLDWKDLPHPTASIEAALTLVPEGYNWSLDYINRRCGAVLNNTPYGKFAILADAATPALALTAAALRAHANKTQTDGACDE